MWPHWQIQISKEYIIVNQQYNYYNWQENAMMLEEINVVVLDSEYHVIQNLLLTAEMYACWLGESLCWSEDHVSYKACMPQAGMTWKHLQETFLLPHEDWWIAEMSANDHQIRNPVFKFWFSWYSTFFTEEGSIFFCMAFTLMHS